MALPNDLNTRWFQAFTTDAGGSPALNVVLAGGTVAGPLLFPNGTGLAQSIAFSTNNGTTDQVGIWKGAVNQINIGNGATGTACVVFLDSNSSHMFSVGSSSASWNVNTSGNFQGVTAGGKLMLPAFVFANIATVMTTNGDVAYCSDCTIANPCAGAGNGAIAKRLNGVNVCN